MLLGFTLQRSLKRSRVYRAGPTAKEYADGENEIKVWSSPKALTVYDDDEANNTQVDTVEAGVALSTIIASKGGGQTEVIFCIVAREFESVLSAMMAADPDVARQLVAKLVPQK